MNSTLAVARRELTEKRFVFAVAATFLLLTLILPFMPGFRSADRAGALVMGSMVLAIGLAYALSVILGATIVGRELSDGRLSFYFSKPVSAASIWWGKLIAAVALIAASFAIVAAPAFLTAGGMTTILRWANTPEQMLPTAGLVLAISIGIFLASHAIGTFIRSRSVWFLADFAAATICGTVAWFLRHQLLLGYAHHLTKTAGITFAVFVGIAIIAAGAWQLEHGRTDLKRSHIELSRFLWTAVGVALIIAAAFVLWVVSVPLSSVQNAFFVQAANGPWAFISGTAGRDDYHPSFLYNISDRRAIPVPGLWSVKFSAVGTTAVGLVPDGLYVVRLDAANPKPFLTHITGDALLQVSSDGSRAIVRSGRDIVTTYDLRTERSLGSARASADTEMWATFRRVKTPEPMLCPADHNGPVLLCHARGGLVLWNTTTGARERLTR